MQTSYPSDHVGNPVTVRRIIFALGLAVAIAVALIATNQIDSVRTEASAPALVPSTTAAQPKQRLSEKLKKYWAKRRRSAKKQAAARG